MSEHIPSSKTIPFPPWTSGAEHLFSVDDIVSTFAMWAVRQSPYGTAVDQLEGACQALAANLRPEWEGAELGFRSLGCMQIEEILDTACKEIPEVLAWNEPKSGHNAQIVSSSRFHKPAQDDDFIDLSALFRNTAHSLFAERTLEVDEPKVTDETGAPQVGEELDAQVDRLAAFIAAEVPGEPSQSEGAVDTAIRWMRSQLVIQLGDFKENGKYPEGLLWDYPWLDGQGEVYAGPYDGGGAALGATVLRVNTMLSEQNRERISKLCAAAPGIASALREVLKHAPSGDEKFQHAVAVATNTVKRLDGTD